MPKYRFKCSTCNKEVEKFCSHKTQELPCADCKTVMKRLLPNSGIQKVTEVVDSFTGVTQTPNQREELKQRRDDHFWEVQVPRLVQEYSLETCLQEGWLVYNDKGELVINKPPRKR